MATRTNAGSSGKIHDPVFMFMLFAVFLAVGSSFALRAVVSGVGPSAAHAAPLNDPSHPDDDRNDPLSDDTGD